MKRSELNPMPNYFDRYILLADDVEVTEALRISLQELKQAPVETWKALGDQVYAPGKWTVKDLLQHIIDTERVFSYRATAFARQDTQKMLPFDEELYGRTSNANQRSITDIFEEMVALRTSTIWQFQSYSEEVLNTIGKGYNSEYSVTAIGFILAGHQRWHFKVLEERYFPLLAS